VEHDARGAQFGNDLERVAHARSAEAVEAERVLRAQKKAPLASVLTSIRFDALARPIHRRRTRRRRGRVSTHVSRAVVARSVASRPPWNYGMKSLIARIATEPSCPGRTAPA
jgi:hypothetical protein